MKKNRKVIAIILGIVIGVGTVVGAGVAIGSVVNRVVGTEAAKILLARENMADGENKFSWDELVSEPVDEPVIQEPMRLSRAFAEEGSSLGTLVHNSPAGKVYKNGGEYIFRDISGASMQGLVIESRLKDIEFRVEQAARSIHYLKNELNIVNKWVKSGFSKYYLDVSSNIETLIEYYADNIGQKSLWVVQRETKENASSTYNLMYTDMTEGRLDNPVYLVYTPNERYEYYYGHDGNATDYLIAEKSKGYWNMFMPDADDYQNVTVSDDFAFSTFGNYDGYSGVSGTVATTNLKEDIIGNGETGFTLHLSAFNGVSGIRAPESIVSENTYDGGEKSYLEIDYLSFNQVEIALNNGRVIKENDSFTYDGKTITLSNISGNFYANPGFADPQYSFSIGFDADEMPLQERIDLIKRFLDDNGLTCKYNLSDLQKSIVKGSEIASTLTDFYTWNGYLMNSSDNFTKAEKIMLDKISSLFSEYEQVKDAEEVSAFMSAKVSRRQDFTSVSNLTVGGAAYSNGKIEISNLSLTAEKSALLESGNEYIVQIGLARIDESGNFSSKNTVHLSKTGTVVSKAYEGEDLTLTASATYEIPLALEEGRYVVAAYVVTADEGIRVSKMIAVGFVDTVADTIETSSVKINIESVDSKLVVEYTSKLHYSIAISGEVDYATLRRKMMAEVLTYGYPMYNEEILNADGVAVTEGNIPAGEYKLRFVVATLDGAVTAYVVCVVG